MGDGSRRRVAPDGGVRRDRGLDEEIGLDVLEERGLEVAGVELSHRLSAEESMAISDFLHRAWQAADYMEAAALAVGRTSFLVACVDITMAAYILAYGLVPWEALGWGSSGLAFLTVWGFMARPLRAKAAELVRDLEPDAGG